MKKFLSLFVALLLSLTLILGLSACGEKEDEIIDDNTTKNETTEENTTDNKKELSTLIASNYFYIDLKIDAGTFRLNGNWPTYGVSGTGTMTYNISPKQPLKCYNAVMKFSNQTPYEIYGYGIEIKFSGTPSINVPADGNATYSVKLEFSVSNANDLSTRVFLWGATESTIKAKIESVQTNVYTTPLTKLIDSSGYIILE